MFLLRRQIDLQSFWDQNEIFFLKNFMTKTLFLDTKNVEFNYLQTNHYTNGEFTNHITMHNFDVKTF